MGSSITYRCSKCGRNWTDDDIFFYLTSDEKIIESGLVMMTSEIERNSVAKGYVCETYCKTCDKDIKIYLLSEVKTHYPSIDLNTILEEYKHNSNKIFGTSEELKEESNVSCPQCHNEMFLKKSFGSEDEFNLNCNIYTSFCDNCKETYTYYAIKSPRKNYTRKEALDIIEKVIDENSILGLSEEYESLTEISCPYCNNTIPKTNTFEKCPKCGGEFYEEVLVIQYD